MKVYRVVATDTATWRGTGEEFELRWQAELAYQAAQREGVIVTLAEFVNGRQTELIRHTKFEKEEQHNGK